MGERETSVAASNAEGKPKRALSCPYNASNHGPGASFLRVNRIGAGDHLRTDDVGCFFWVLG